MADDTFPRTIEVGGGPNIEVNSQAEHDAFFKAARRNSEIMLRDRMEEEAWPYVVYIVNTALERPDAPLATCGPFADRAAAQEFAEEWDERLTCSTVKALAGRMASPAYIAEWLVSSGAFDLADDASEVKS